jgi:hypothetical protein
MTDWLFQVGESPKKVSRDNINAPADLNEENEENGSSLS